MCLITTQKEPIKITEDLTVYKIVRYNTKDIRFSHYYNCFNYNCGELYKTEIKESTEVNYFDSLADELNGISKLLADSYIEPSQLSLSKKRKLFKENGFLILGQGYHFITKEGLELRDKSMLSNNFISCCFDTICISICTIPKGSLVYYDKSGLGISNQIIITHKIINNIKEYKQIFK